MRPSPASSMTANAPPGPRPTSPAEWQAIFDAMLDPVALLDAVGVIRHYNRAFAGLTGYDAEGAIGLPCHVAIHGADCHVSGCPQLRTRASGQRETMELPIGDRIFLVVTDPIKAADGGLSGFVHVMRDITEQKRAEQALRESVERFQTIARNLPNGIIHIFDRDFRYVYNEGEELRKVGLTHELLVGKTIYDALGPALAERVAAHYRRVLQGETVRFEGDFAGETFLVQAAPLRDADGEVAQILVLSVNITGLRRAEGRLHLALEAVNDGIWEWNPKTGQVDWSARSYTMLGYKPDEFPMSLDRWFELLHPDDRQAAWGDLQRQINLPDRSFSIEFRYRRKDGRWAWINGRGRTVAVDDQGDIVRVIGTHTDITERKEAEARLAEQLEELRRWHAATLGREERILELKREVNALLRQAGQPPRYASAEEGAHG